MSVPAAAVALRCVTCGALGLDPIGTTLACRGCAARFPIVAGVPRFVAAELYSQSFGFQWTRFARTQLDSARDGTASRDTFVEKTGWSLGDLRGRHVLDAGCGMGRFAEVCAEAGAEVHAVDLSVAVEAAASNLAGRTNVHVYQADIMNLPFAPESFDRIYSIGVLHHTPSTRSAFARLLPLLRPGGDIAIWVYQKPRVMLGSDIWRAVTPSLPKRWLLGLSRAAVPLYHVHRLPIIGRLTQWALPSSLAPEPEWRWLDTFDWYSPRYQWKHTDEEVEGWFREAGLTDIWRGRIPVSVRGTRPLAA
jgi:SAM-dependent methyltransferase